MCVCVYACAEVGDPEKDEIARLCRLFMALLVCHLRGMDGETPADQERLLSTTSEEQKFAFQEDITNVELRTLASNGTLLQRNTAPRRVRPRLAHTANSCRWPRAQSHLTARSSAERT